MTVDFTCCDICGVVWGGSIGKCRSGITYQPAEEQFWVPLSGSYLNLVSITHPISALIDPFPHSTVVAVLFIFALRRHSVPYLRIRTWRVQTAGRRSKSSGAARRWGSCPIRPWRWGIHGRLESSGEAANFEEKPAINLFHLTPTAARNRGVRVIACIYRTVYSGARMR